LTKLAASAAKAAVLFLIRIADAAEPDASSEYVVRQQRAAENAREIAVGSLAFVRPLER
jgi:hypothetical protein